MAIRLRKSIRLGKNARINLSKSGASVTLGRPGASVNVGSRGTYLNLGVPGTGVSSRTRLGGPQAKPKDAKPGQSRGQDQGRGPSGGTGSGAALLGQAEELARQIDQETTDIVSIHEAAPEVFSHQEYLDALAALVPPTYTPKPFGRPEPAQPEIEAMLWQKAESEVRPLFNREQKRQEYFNQNYQGFWQEYVSQWQAEKAAFEHGENEARHAQGILSHEEYAQQKAFYERRLQNDAALIEDDIGQWLSELDLPVEMSAQIQYQPDQSALYIDLDLPEIEDLPKTTAVVLKSGQVKEKDKTQKQQRQDYALAVFGLAVFLAAGCFGVNANIAGIVISGYSQRRNSQGDIQDDYIYSVKIPRESLAHVEVSDPEQFILSCENRLKLSQTHVFSPIVPY